jgi:hypothetical protein
VIADADRSLGNFLEAALGKGTAVTFETPSEELAKSIKRPAVSCFLHRVVEDIARRDADWADQRSPEGRVAARQPPVRHYQLHYQVSAWAKSVDEEHELLGKVMHACLGGEIVSAAHLAGVFEGEEQPLLIRLGVPVPDPGPQPHDVWSSLGVPLRASLELTLVAPLRPILVTDVAPPAEELSLTMEKIGLPAQREGSAESSILGEKRWTKFRIREKTSSDDPGLDGVGNRV